MCADRACVSSHAGISIWGKLRPLGVYSRCQGNVGIPTQDSVFIKFCETPIPSSYLPSERIGMISRDYAKDAGL